MGNKNTPPPAISTAILLPCLPLSALHARRAKRRTGSRLMKSSTRSKKSTPQQRLTRRWFSMPFAVQVTTSVIAPGHTASRSSGCFMKSDFFRQFQIDVGPAVRRSQHRSTFPINCLFLSQIFFIFVSIILT